MRTYGTTRKLVAVLSVLAACFLAPHRSAAAEPPASLRDAAWTWGYVIPGKIPGQVPFVFSGQSRCSLETAATYMGTPNVVLMNGIADTPKEKNQWTSSDLERLKGCKRVLCAVQVHDIASAAKISELSKTYPNIVGAMIDDFYPVEEKVPVDALKNLYTALKNENSALKLYVVRYTHSKDEELIPYLPYFDAVNLWVWVANKEEWTSKIDGRIEKLEQVTHKPVVMGIFLHNYGEPAPDNTKREPWTWTKPVPMDILETQLVKTTDLLKKGKIEGFVLLQNGWFDQENHRPQIQWTKQYLDWLFQTETVRN